MTLDQIVSHVTQKVGQTDSTSVAICQDFVKHRYDTIWNSNLWRDSQIQASATLTANTNIIVMPTGIDRLITVTANGKFLDPVTASYLQQADPTIFTRTGTPLYYEEYTDSASTAVKSIRFYPTPTVNTSLFMIGKRVRPELTTGSGDYSSPILRNIDNALIAYTIGDMLERQRQYAKSQQKFTEASALLDAAKAVEASQANQPRRSKSLTVAGNSLAEMTDAVCARTGTWTLDDVILIKDLLKRNYQTVYDAHLWQESTALALVESDGEQLVLPDYLATVISIRVNPQLSQLVPVEVGYLFGIAPNIFEQTTGDQLSYSFLTPVAVAVVPPGNEALSIVSSDASDKSPVFIRGESQGDIVTETITLNGTTPVITANTYDYPLTIAKQVTTGDVTITGNTSTVQLQKIPATERERKHMRLWLHPATDDIQDCIVFGKRRINPLVADEDTPMLREVANVLIEMTTADVLMKMKDSASATAAAGKAEKSLQRLIDLETKQGASQPRVIPYTEPSYSVGFDYYDTAFIAK